LQDTSLSLYQFFKLEDIWSSLFEVRCRICIQRRDPRNCGDAQLWWVKALLGLGLFILLVIVVWFPLLFLMQGSPGLRPNLLTGFEAKVWLANFDPIYSTFQRKTFTQNDSKDFSEFRQEFKFLSSGDKSGIQFIEMYKYSSSLWRPPPPSRLNLVRLLEEEAEIDIAYTLTFRRDFPSNVCCGNILCC